MSRRHRRFDVPPDPAAAVRALRACRGTMVDVMRSVKPIGPVYRAAGTVTAAIDGLAALLTGDREYFRDTGTVGSGVSALRDKLARESGELPWEPPGRAELKTGCETPDLTVDRDLGR